MKLLHSADWHLDSPMNGWSREETAFLRSELMGIPEKVARLCRSEQCDAMLLSGDLFDGPYTKESFRAVSHALEDAGVPVFITPGNHDFCRVGSPYSSEVWPGNVHIFKNTAMESVLLPEFDCEVFGAGYSAMDCPPLLKDFHCAPDHAIRIGVLHGDATQSSSPYCPISAQQVRDSGLQYLALGHIHKAGSFRAGGTLCAWPGCPMGRGYDETGMGGVLIAELGGEVKASFMPLGTLQFHDNAVDAGEDPIAAAGSLLPGVKSEDFYRLTFTGYSQPIDLDRVKAAFPHVKHLQLRDRTLPEIDLWSAAGEDTLEGVYFKLLKDGMDTGSEVLKRHLKLAARISRQILDGQEVTLP